MTEGTFDGAFDDAVKTVRFLSVDGVEAANSGHPGTPMALAGIAVEIWTRHLRFVPEQPGWPNRDRFVLSCGHASMLVYSLLHLAGFELPLDELKRFRQWGSKTPGHPEVGHTVGVETTTGPLGQGVGNAVGLALASRMLAARAGGAPLFDYRVFAICSDGDLMEGVASEAASLGGHLGLDNLVMVYDDNRITIDGTTDLSFSEDVAQRFAAYGWSVSRVDGHDPAAVRQALDAAVAETGKPKLLLARTRIGIGAPTKEGTSKAHGAPLGKAEVEATKLAAGWPLEPFHVAPRAREPFQRRAETSRALFEEWKRAYEALDADRRRTVDQLLGRHVPADLLQQLIAVAAPAKEATRSISARLQQRVAELVPSFVGGAADLAESTKTHIKGGGDVARGSYAGRNLAFGIREHGMGSIVNGLALSGGFVPYGSTFLIFSDYMRPSVRLSALMERQVLFVYTHDSVFVGEDGPTHQPVEHLWALRLIPNLDVVRPADALECAAAWAHALRRKDGPTAFALSRQNLPPLARPEGFDPERIVDGAYALSGQPDAELVLIATGSEVGVAVDAARLLGEQGKTVRVVSMPCWDAFQRLPAARRAEILGTGRRVSIEAGATLGWRALVGEGGLAIGIDRFGASAPAERLAEELGLTAAKVVERVLAS
ncbi:MAG: transketolase [Polyangiaceae bacterium]|nr:transketolase [Polyangiaceae bacterium]